MQSVNEKYQDLLSKIDALRASLHVIDDQELTDAIAQLDKLEAVVRHMENTYGDEL